MIWVWKFTDDEGTSMESCHTTEQDADEWRDKIATNYPTWTTEDPREEPDNYQPKVTHASE